MPSATHHEDLELKPLAVYDKSESAQLLHIGVRKLSQLVAEGKIKPLPYCTGKHLFSGRELAAFIGIDVDRAAS